MIHEEEIAARAVELELAVQEWFREHPEVRAVYAKQLCDYLADKQVIKKQNHNQQTGLNYLLRKLWERDDLRLAPSARLYGSSWIFARTEKDEPPRKETAKMAALRKYGIVDEE